MKDVIHHNLKCERIKGGECFFCIMGRYNKTHLYSWVGTTGSDEWGDKKANLFGKFHINEILDVDNLAL